MYLITCSDNCKYQEDGYCMLDTASLVTNCEEGHCIHYVVKNEVYYNSDVSLYNNIGIL